MKNPFARIIFRTWFTGALYILGIIGYLFYGFLWTIRLMQTSKRFLLLGILPLVLCAGVLVFLFFPLHKTTEPVELIVEKGMPLHAISRLLEKEKIIPSSFVFIMWVKLHHWETKVQAGKFVLYRGEGILSAAQRMLHAISMDISVTIPEGLTIEQTSSVLKNALSIDSAAFVVACANQKFLTKLHLTNTTIEGYLFPDTYRFSPDVKIDDIISRMISHFEEMYVTITNALQLKTNFSKNDFVILASIVEKEATLASERPLIAGVFHNRLQQKIPLGADPTIRFYLKRFNGALHVSELALQTPYNTRQHVGLTPGPICSPGLASLKAAMNPLATKNLFFVAKWDGSGAHDFSVTNAEHVRKKNEIRRINENRKTRSKEALK